MQTEGSPLRWLPIVQWVGLGVERPWHGGMRPGWPGGTMEAGLAWHNIGPTLCPAHSHYMDTSPGGHTEHLQRILGLNKESEVCVWSAKIWQDLNYLTFCEVFMVSMMEHVYNDWYSEPQYFPVSIKRGFMSGTMSSSFIQWILNTIKAQVSSVVLFWGLALCTHACSVVWGQGRKGQGLSEASTVYSHYCCWQTNATTSAQPTSFVAVNTPVITLETLFTHGLSGRTWKCSHWTVTCNQATC